MTLTPRQCDQLAGLVAAASETARRSLPWLESGEPISREWVARRAQAFFAGQKPRTWQDCELYRQLVRNGALTGE